MRTCTCARAFVRLYQMKDKTMKIKEYEIGEHITSKKSVYIVEDSHKKCRLCSYIKFTKQGIDENNDRHYICVKFMVDGEYKEIWINPADVQTTFNCTFKTSIENKGFRWPIEKKVTESLLKHLKSTVPPIKLTIQHHKGWFENKAIVLDHRTIGDRTGVALLPQPASEINRLTSEAGSLLIWRKYVSEATMHSAPLLFMLAIALSNLILRFAPETGNRLFNFYGPSRRGKTTMEKIVWSLFYSLLESNIPTFDGTKNGRMSFFRNHSETVTVLDELGSFEGDDKALLKEIGIMMHSLHNGGERQTASNNPNRVQNQKTVYSHLIVSYERALEKVANDIGNKREGGQKMRAIDIDAVYDDRKGIFFSLPERHDNGTSYSHEILAKIRENYGKAGVKYARHLVGNVEQLPEIISKHESEFFDAIKLSYGRGENHSFAKPFATGYAALCLAREAGVLRRTPAKMLKQIIEVYQKALVIYRSSDDSDEDLIYQLREAIRTAIRQPDDSRITGTGITIKLDESSAGHPIFMLLRPDLIKIMGSEKRVDNLVKALEANRLLCLYSDGSPQLTRTSNGKRKKYYGIYEEGLIRHK